jgi:hypothetical protein
LNGRSIRIYLVDGDASGLLTAEVMNWSGKFVVAPRTMLRELALREEVSRTGVYILSGPDPENPSQDMIYVVRATMYSSESRRTTRILTKSFGLGA